MASPPIGRVLITGGCGFLGQHLLAHLVEPLSAGALAGVDVLDLRPPAVALFDFDTNAAIRRLPNVDIRDYEAIPPAFAGVDCVIHLAGLVSFAWRDRDALHGVNVGGTANVVRAVREHGVRRFIHVSSVAALGYGDDPARPIDEDYEFDWSIARRVGKFYMLTKHLADLEVSRIERDVPCVTLYPGLMFGPGDTTNSARLIEAIGRGKVPFNMPGGTNIVDVRDIARGIASILLQPDVTGHYLLSGWNLTFCEVNAIIARQLGVQAPRRMLGRWTRPFLVPVLRAVERIGRRTELTADQLDSAYLYRYFDHSRAKQRLGWEPRIGFEQMIQDTITWMRADGRLEE